MNGIKTSLLYRMSLNNGLIILGSLILNFISFRYPVFYLFFALYLLYVYLKQKNLSFIILIMNTLFFLYLLVLSHYLQYQNALETYGRVCSISSGDYYNRYIISQGWMRYGVIDSSNRMVKIGDYIYAQGTNPGVTTEQVEYGYSEALTYLSNRYIIHLKDSEVTVINHKWTFWELKGSIYNALNRGTTGSSLMLGLILGDHSLMDDTVYNSFTINGITHLFAVSGLHVDMTIHILERLLSLFKIKDTPKKYVLSGFLITYMTITQFSPSIVRASLLYISRIITDKYALRYTSLDRLSLIMILMICVNPLYLFKGSFTLSFLSSGTLILMSPLIKKVKPLKASFILSTVVTIVTLPYSVYYNMSINLLTPLLNIIFIGLVSYLIFPLTLIALITPHISLIQEAYNTISQAFYNFSSVCSEYAIKVELPYLTPSLIVLFYGIFFGIIILFKEREYLDGPHKKPIITRFLSGLLVFILSLILLTIKPLNNQIIFFDLYQGDASLICLNQHYYLIDTGSGRQEVVTRYLLNHNIKTLECLIITHNDNDHNGEYLSLKNNLKIKKLIINWYDDYNYNLINTIKVKAYQTVNLIDMSLHILAPLDTAPTSTNETSLVFTVNLQGHTFLFTGDSPYTILETLKYPSIDYLKVSHHGSVTGTSLAFLKKITPQAAIIMAGHVSTFNFPNEEVLELLKEEKIIFYATNTLKSITYDMAHDTFTGLLLEKKYGLW